MTWRSGPPAPPPGAGARCRRAPRLWTECSPGDKFKDDRGPREPREHPQGAPGLSWRFGGPPTPPGSTTMPETTTTAKKFRMSEFVKDGYLAKALRTEIEDLT